MTHLQSLTDLLCLAQLSPEALDKVLEHDRWKTETVLGHELKIEELRQQYLHGGYASESNVYSQDDLSFNLISSYSECNESQVFKVAKTKVKLGVIRLCEEKYKDIDKIIKGDQRYKDIPERDKGLNLKTLITLMMHLSCCSERLRKWPLAKDKTAVMQIQKELELKSSRLDSLTLIVAFDSLSTIWPSLFDSEVCFNSPEMTPIIEKAQLEVEYREKMDIKESPLFKRTKKEIPSMDLDKLKQYYETFGEKSYVESGIKVLSLSFTKNRPPELDSTDEYAEWSNIYINYLHEYKEKWKNQLKGLEIETWDDQLAWHKESTL